MRPIPQQSALAIALRVVGLCGAAAAAIGFAWSKMLAATSPLQPLRTTNQVAEYSGHYLRPIERLGVSFLIAFGLTAFVITLSAYWLRSRRQSVERSAAQLGWTQEKVAKYMWLAFAFMGTLAIFGLERFFAYLIAYLSDGAR